LGSAGGLNAIISWVLDKELQFKVTPKGTNTPKFLPLKVLLPYLALAFVSGASVIPLKNVRMPGIIC